MEVNQLMGGGGWRWRGLYGGSPFSCYKSNQEKHEEMAPFRGEMTHPRRITGAFHRGHPSAIKLEASKIA